jgi:general secretion pathway protein D
VPIAVPQPPAIVAEAERERAVGSTFLPGTGAVPAPEAPRPRIRPGDVEANIPGGDVRVVARTVSDLVGVPIVVAEGVTQQVSLVTPGKVSRPSLLALFETALKGVGLALTPQGQGFRIQPEAEARGAGTPPPGAVGFGQEILPLQFVSADEIRKILDRLVPGTVAAAQGNSITIAGTSGQRAAARDIVRQFDVNWLRAMSFALFVPERTDARLIAPEIDRLLNAPDAPTRGLVRLIAMERLNGILAISPQRQYLEDVRRWVEVLDREGDSAQPRIFVYRVQNGRARDLARTLSAAFGTTGAEGGATNQDPFERDRPEEAENPRAPRPPEPREEAPGPPGGPNAAAPPAGGPATRGPDVRITADEVNNAVIVFGRPKDFAVVEEALRKLDVPPAQVMIEAAITEVSLNDALRYGVQWNFATGNANFALVEAGADGVTPTRITPGFSFFYGATDITATLNALEARTNIKVVSAPKLLVLNNQTAALQVGDQVPILTQSSVGVQNPDSPIVNSVTYRDTGVILRITPRVNAGGLVLIDISQEVSDLSQNQVEGISSPTIATRRVATTIAVQDGQVIAIGGLFRDSKSLTNAGLPFLSRIPVLGGLLFGRRNDTQLRTELIILLKPQVLRTADDGRAITEELRAKLRTLEPFRTEGRIP